VETLFYFFSYSVGLRAMGHAYDHKTEPCNSVGTFFLTPVLFTMNEWMQCVSQPYNTSKKDGVCNASFRKRSSARYVVNRPMMQYRRYAAESNREVFSRRLMSVVERADLRWHRRQFVPQQSIRSVSELERKRRPVHLDLWPFDLIF